MGMDGFVHCRCVQDGLVTPPVATTFDGQFLEPVDRTSMSLEEVIAFDRWKLDACEHPEMDLVVERIGNWAEYGMVKDFIGASTADLPVLRAELPSSNGGTTPWTRSLIALGELDQLVASQPFFEILELVDLGTGRVVRETGHFGSEFINEQGDVLIHFDETHLCVSVGGATVFRSTRFQQRLSADVESAFDLIDVYGASVTLGSPICGPLIGRDDEDGLEVPPTEFEVRPARFGVENIEWRLGALSRLFRASVDSRNPVVWC